MHSSEQAAGPFPHNCVPWPSVNAVLACEAPVTLRRLGHILRYNAQHLRGDMHSDVGNQYIQSSRM